MQVERAYDTRAMRRRSKDVVRPTDILNWWQEAHGYLSAEHRRSFLKHPATQELCAFPLLSVKSAVSVEKKLDEARERVRSQARGYNRPDDPVSPPSGPRRDMPTSRSTWLGGDVQDVEEEQRRAEERRLARAEVDRPEPYL